VACIIRQALLFLTRPLLPLLLLLLPLLLLLLQLLQLAGLLRFFLLLHLGPGENCSPRHPANFQTSSLELNGTL
jgi:hypothetical protein